MLHECRSRKHPAITFTDTNFADDITFVSDNIQDGIALTQRAEEAAKQIGVHINTTKTEVMSFNEQVKIFNTLVHRSIQLRM